MKKIGILFFAALLVVAFTMPAAALETQFGGYWRTRAMSYNNFTGEDDSEDYDYQLVDTRTRIYFTAILNDNLKLVNKFEFDADWGVGGSRGYGDIGTDGKVFEIKNSYADFNIGSVNAKIGAQYGELARGFLFADDFIGATVTFQGEGFSLPFIWMKPYEGENGKDANDMDVDYIALNPTFNVADNVTVNPFIMYAYSDDISGYDPAVHSASPNGPWMSFDGINATVSDFGTFEEMGLYFLGINLDATLGAASVWFTGIYEGGSIDGADASTEDIDVSAFIVAGGASANLGGFDVHAQAFYGSGDDDDADDDYEAFWVPSQGSWYGQSYYWAELMGYGMFDDQVSNGSPSDKISNVIAAGLGTSVKPMDKLTLGIDVWYAQLAEEDFTGEDELGTEVDLSLTYELVEGLNLDIVAAYLFAGDRTNADVNILYDSNDNITGLSSNGQSEDDADPWELGARLSLRF